MEILLKCDYLTSSVAKTKDGRKFNLLKVIGSDDVVYTLFPKDIEVFKGLKRYDPLELSILSYYDKNNKLRLKLLD